MNDNTSIGASQSATGDTISSRGYDQRDRCVTSGVVGTLGECAPQARNISIRSLNHGFVVEVGCQSFAIEDISVLTRKLEMYLRDPAKTEKLWYDKKLF